MDDIHLYGEEVPNEELGFVFISAVIYLFFSYLFHFENSVN